MRSYARRSTRLTRVMAAWCLKAEVSRAAALATPPATVSAPALPPLTGREIRARILAALPPASTHMTERDIVMDHDGRVFARRSQAEVDDDAAR